MTAAIYCRLSREDEEKQSESESIQNQKSMLIKYALDKGWDIYNIYCDEDYSGIDRERPAFRQLIADAEARRFDIVLVKTQSRFTRDMELVEKYIHGLFEDSRPEMRGIFMSVMTMSTSDSSRNASAVSGSFSAVTRIRHNLH